MSHARVVAAAGIYGTFGALAWAATAAVGCSPWHLGRTLGDSRWVSLPVSLVLGVATGVAGVWASRALVRHSAWGLALHRELRLGVVGVSPRAALPLSLASAVGEEVFFRGGLQAGLVALWGPAAGLALAALVFGAVHVPWNRRLWSWTATALVMGVVFGGLYLLTGELLASIAAHAVINYENFRFLLAHDPPAAPRGPTLARR